MLNAMLLASLFGAAGHVNAAQSLGLDIPGLAGSGSRVVLADTSSSSPACLKLTRHWTDQVMTASLHSGCKNPIAVASVIVIEAAHRFAPDTSLYGEGFTMLSLTAGTLRTPEDLEPYTDRAHYRIPQPAGAQTFYGVTLLSPSSDQHVLLGFLSSKRYVGSISVWPDRLQIAFDTEGLTISPGQMWTFEPVYAASGSDDAAMLDEFGSRVGEASNARVTAAPAPTGWSTWNALGDTPTAAAILENTRLLAGHAPDLDYVQIDDGYQPFMGDWLDVRTGFGSSIADLARSIRREGKAPALWVAPLIAERDSALFRAHPEWFIKDNAGKPLASNTFTFGGWRRGPWYGLDGSNPEVQRHLEAIFRRMREEWGVDYFKLDALFWGAMHGGHFYDPSATRISAYRAALAAIRRGAGDAFMTVANAPLWPTIGFADASRSSMDVSPTWKSFRTTARETRYRAWMHRRLWLNDPDSLMIAGQASEAEMRAHWTSVLMSGGPLLVGDDLTKLSAAQLAMIGKLGRPVQGRAIVTSRNVDMIELDGAKAVINWGDDRRRSLLAGQPLSRWHDIWTGRSYDFEKDGVSPIDLEAHDAVLLRKSLPDAN